MRVAARGSVYVSAKRIERELEKKNGEKRREIVKTE